MILNGHVYSQTLEMETGISIVTPNKFASGSPYQIAYLLHGVCGNSSDMVNYTMLPVYADAYRCIFVMPEAGRSLYADMAYGQNFFSYVAEELPQICRSVINISAKREDTFIIGHSMGGYGALKCALTYPGRYAACCANAAGPLFLKDFLRELREGEADKYRALWGRQFVDDYRAAFGEDYAWQPEVEPLELAKRIDTPEAAPVIYAMCGTEDALLEINRQFSEQMSKLPVRFHYEELPGGHDWYFFDAALRKGLAYCLGGKSF